MAEIGRETLMDRASWIVCCAACSDRQAQWHRATSIVVKDGIFHGKNQKLDGLLGRGRSQFEVVEVNEQMLAKVACGVNLWLLGLVWGEWLLAWGELLPCLSAVLHAMAGSSNPPSLCKLRQPLWMPSAPAISKKSKKRDQSCRGRSGSTSNARETGTGSSR